jgi:hypothetical protein
VSGEAFGVLFRLVGTGGAFFGVPTQGDFDACVAFGVERFGASVLLSASRLAGKSGSRLPHSKAFGHSVPRFTIKL